MEKKKSNIKWIIIIAAIVAAAAIVIVLAVSNSPSRRVTKLLDLGDRYLESCEYEQALAAYDEVLRIDAMNVDAFLGMVEAYIRQGDFEKALEYAEAGYEKTGDERLKEKIDMINSGSITDSKGNLLKESFYDGDGNLLRYQIFTYNSAGQAVTVTSYDAKGNVVSGLDLTYDEEGRPVNSYSNYVTGGLLRVVFEFDEMGRRSSGTFYDEEDFSRISSVERYSYNGNQEAAYRRDTTYYGVDGEISLSRYTLLEINEDGLITKCETYDDYSGNGEYELSSVSSATYRSDGKRDRWEEIGYYQGKENSHIIYEYKYDEQGNELGYIMYDDDGSVIYENIRLTE